MKSPMIDKYKCGCVIAGDKLGIITWDKCAIHSKAPAMYKALKDIREQVGRYDWSGGDYRKAITMFLAHIESIAASALEN